MATGTKVSLNLGKDDFVSQDERVDSSSWTKGRYSTGYNLIVIVSGIVIAETIAMIVVYFFQHLPYYQQVVLDAAVMTLIITPLLYFLSARPLIRHIRQRAQTESLQQSRLRLARFATRHSLDELLQSILDETETLTGSTIGFFHFLDSDQKKLQLKAWSTNTIKHMCTVTAHDRHYDVDQAGVWADCIRQRRPVIHNHYAALAHRKGLPDGHATIVRLATVPILRADKIVGIIGTGNKSSDYTWSDVELVSTLADFAWDIVSDKQSSDALHASEEKFRTLVDWTYDWELWVDPSGAIIYTSPSCKRITGYGPEAFQQNSELLRQIVHPEDQSRYSAHYLSVHQDIAEMETMEYRIVDRNGREHWLEHICRPLFGENNRYLGRRVNNRDITERKQAEQQILERNQREKVLTQTIHTLQLDIARDLHDTLGQNISYLRMKLDYLDGRKLRRQSDLQAEIRNMAQAANESYDLLRGTLAVLQSTESHDLYHLLIRYTGQIEERAGFKVEFSRKGEPRPISAPRMRQLFYIFREILNNIEKHACARHVNIDIVWDVDHLEMVVSDDGQGFDENDVHFSGHYGLRFMRQRVELLNGSLMLHSQPGSGTKVAVLIPYETS